MEEKRRPSSFTRMSNLPRIPSLSGANTSSLTFETTAACSESADDMTALATSARTRNRLDIDPLLRLFGRGYPEIYAYQRSAGRRRGHTFRLCRPRKALRRTSSRGGRGAYLY